MSTTIRIKRTATPDRAPIDLAEGELAVEMASDPLRLWVGVPESIDATGRRLLTGGGVTGDYLPLTGGTLYQPDTATELRVQADNGLDAGIFFLTTDVDEWWAGTYGTGDFCIYDMADAAGGERLRIDEGGTIGIPGRLSVGDLAWFGDQLHVTAGAWLNGGASITNLDVTGWATIADLRVTGTGIAYPNLGPNLNRVGFTWTGTELRPFVDGLDQGAVLTNGFNGTVQFNGGLHVAGSVNTHDLIIRSGLWQGEATPIGNAISAVNLHAQNELHVQGPAWLNGGISVGGGISTNGGVTANGVIAGGSLDINGNTALRGTVDILGSWLQSQNDFHCQGHAWLNAGAAIGGALAVNSGRIISAGGNNPSIGLWNTGSTENAAWGMWAGGVNATLSFGPVDGSANPVATFLVLDGAGTLTANHALAVSGRAWLNGGCELGGNIDTVGNVVMHTGGRTAWWQVDGALTANSGATILGTTATNFLQVNASGDVGVAIQAPNGVAARLRMDLPGRTWFVGVHPDNLFMIQDNAGGAQIWRLAIDPGGLTQLNGGLLVHGVASRPGGGVWADSSDRRLKKDIEAYIRGLDAIRQLRPVTYRFNGLAGTRDDGVIYHGLIAQDVLDIMPEMVGEDPFRGGYMMDCTALTYALVNAARELAEKNAALTARVAALEERS